jgi:hypothetical protein
MTTPDLDRFNYLFELALKDELESGSEEIAGLSSEDKSEFEQIKYVFYLIDANWLITADQQDKVRTLFLQELAADNPNHPWVQEKVVHTLGDLVRVCADEALPLRGTSYESISKDETPIEALLDSQRRKLAVTQALRKAKVPVSLMGDVLMWLNRALGALSPAPKTIPQGLLFTRRQGSGRGGK